MAGPATGPRHAPAAVIGADADGRFESNKLGFELHMPAARWRSTHGLLGAGPAVKLAALCLLCVVELSRYRGKCFRGVILFGRAIGMLPVFTPSAIHCTAPVSRSINIKKSIQYP